MLFYTYRNNFLITLKRITITIFICNSFFQAPLSSELPLQNCLPDLLNNFIPKSLETNYDRSLVDHGFWRFLHENDLTPDVSRWWRLSDSMNQRENWYEVSPYISEFKCSLSNLAILGVGIHDRSPYSIFAALMSGISHAIPTQIAHDIDFIGVAVVALIVLYNREIIIKSPRVLLHGAAAFAVGATDFYINYYTSQYDHLGSLVHSIWHLFAANALHELNKELARNNVKNALVDMDSLKEKSVWIKEKITNILSSPFRS